MNFRLTRGQKIILLSVGFAILLISVFPTFGPPNFRYTGSDPNRFVWNLGWPLATCIYDADAPPFFFVGPFAAYVCAFAVSAGLVLAYAMMFVWNNCRALMAKAKINDADQILVR
ncbi:hypothetical protein Pan258_52160 [Symmachiella dynata]|uniref:hypothetical protein n=1 Tax=Symmachiella dynata TaxID=2527995 RepID=UPI00118B3DC8|nr:hypothetical protein [Symmachiella dynata]QDT51133.1 hypothetical protein Pan258_52160 [Symmachiella dynata]